MPTRFPTLAPDSAERPRRATGPYRSTGWGSFDAFASVTYIHCNLDCCRITPRELVDCWRSVGGEEFSRLAVLIGGCPERQRPRPVHSGMTVLHRRLPAVAFCESRPS
jgi:hypothetical protein